MIWLYIRLKIRKYDIEYGKKYQENTLNYFEYGCTGGWPMVIGNYDFQNAWSYLGKYLEFKTDKLWETWNVKSFIMLKDNYIYIETACCGYNSSFRNCMKPCILLTTKVKRNFLHIHKVWSRVTKMCELLRLQMNVLSPDYPCFTFGNVHVCHNGSRYL